MTVFPDSNSEILDKYSLKTFWGKNCTTIIISMAIFKHIITCYLYTCSWNLFKSLHLLAQREFCIVEKGIISFFKPPALSVFCCKIWSLLIFFFCNLESFPWLRTQVCSASLTKAPVPNVSTLLIFPRSILCFFEI